MYGLNSQNSFVTFIGIDRPDGTISFAEIKIATRSQTCTLNGAGGITDLHPKIVKLAHDLLSNAKKNAGRRHPFLCRVGNLQFEDYRPVVSDDGFIRVQLRLTKGKIVDFFEGPEDQNSLPELEDVFLPLTNLASYLRAVGDTPSGSPGPQALHLTADRIDEFLLIYGGRLLDKAHAEPSSLHALF